MADVLAELFSHQTLTIVVLTNYPGPYPPLNTNSPTLTETAGFPSSSDALLPPPCLLLMLIRLLLLPACRIALIGRAKGGEAGGELAIAPEPLLRAQMRWRH